MLKKIGNVLVFLWMVVIKLCRAVFARNKAGANKSTNTNNWKATEWEEWEVPEVKVELTTPINTEEEGVEAIPDLFKDMTPVIHTTKKIKLKGSGSHSNGPPPNLNQFAVDPAFTQTSSELLDWSDEEMLEGWSDDKDMPELLRQSRSSRGRKKRGGEVRTTPTTGKATPTLGTTRLGATRLN